jgi:hypothetical protein
MSIILDFGLRFPIVVFTAAQHRQIAKLLTHKAEKVPDPIVAAQLLRLAAQHMGLAAAQDRDPRLRPKMPAVTSPSLAPV